MDSANLTLLAQVRLLAMDIDGVLTDGTLGYDHAGHELKWFHVADGLGITAMRLAGIHVAWISGRSGEGARRRASELKVEHVALGITDKGRALADIADGLRIERASIAYIGDDWNDLAAFSVAGVKIAVCNADAAVQSSADCVTERSGGHGAVREVCDTILMAQGRTSEVLSQYLEQLKATSLHATAGQ